MGSPELSIILLTLHSTREVRLAVSGGTRQLGDTARAMALLSLAAQASLVLWRHGVLDWCLLAVAVQRRLLPARAGGLGGADADSSRAGHCVLCVEGMAANALPLIAGAYQAMTLSCSWAPRRQPMACAAFVMLTKRPVWGGLTTARSRMWAVLEGAALRWEMVMLLLPDREGYISVTCHVLLSLEACCCHVIVHVIVYLVRIGTCAVTCWCPDIPCNRYSEHLRSLGPILAEDP